VWEIDEEHAVDYGWLIEREIGIVTLKPNLIVWTYGISLGSLIDGHIQHVMIYFFLKLGKIYMGQYSATIALEQGKP